MIGDDKTLPEAAAAADAPDGHPPRGLSHRHLAEDAEPPAPGDRRRRDHERPPLADALGPRWHRVDRRQTDTAVSIGADELHDGTVAVDRADRRIDHRREPLRLAEGIGEEDARLSLGLIRPPPGVDLGGYGVRRRPAVDRQAKRRLGDEDIAAHRLEGGARRVGGGLVIATHDPHLPCMLDADLRRPEHMAGRMERDLHPAERRRFAVAERVDRHGAAEAAPHHELAGGSAEVAIRPRPGMIGVGMGDDGAGHRPPGVDPEAPCRAMEPGIAHHEKIRHPLPPPATPSETALVAEA